MRLADHLRETNQTDRQFAERITARLWQEDPARPEIGHYTIRRYCLAPGHKDRRIPGPDIMRAIFLETGGRVAPNDFYDLSAAPRSAAPGGSGGKGARSSAVAPASAIRRMQERQRASRKGWRSRKARAAAAAGAAL